MFFAVFFAFWRFMEIITLIPTMGMLAYFVHFYVERNLLTPNSILILFIVSVLGLAWALFTLFSYHRSSSNAQFIAFVDLGFVGAFIAGVHALRYVRTLDCVNISPGSTADISLGLFGSAQLNTVGVSVNKTCGMLKACFAFGIMNCIFFFSTAILALIHGNKSEAKEKKHSRERNHSHRRSHSGSHRSRRSSHSHSRTYV